MGDPPAQLAAAARELAALPATRVCGLSSLHRTEPVDYENQPWFYNAVARLATEFGPLALLRALQAIEARLGRVRGIRFGPRQIDCDLISYGALSLTHPDLILPHPRFADRAFVLVPLAELAPEESVQGRPISAWRDDLAKRPAGAKGIERVPGPWPSQIL